MSDTENKVLPTHIVIDHLTQKFYQVVKRRYFIDDDVPFLDDIYIINDGKRQSAQQWTIDLRLPLDHPSQPAISVVKHPVTLDGTKTVLSPKAICACCKKSGFKSFWFDGGLVEEDASDQIKSILLLDTPLGGPLCRRCQFLTQYGHMRI